MTRVVQTRSCVRPSIACCEPTRSRAGLAVLSGVFLDAMVQDAERDSRRLH
jgi:hypothetical protein